MSLGIASISHVTKTGERLRSHDVDYMYSLCLKFLDIISDDPSLFGLKYSHDLIFVAFSQLLFSVSDNIYLRVCHYCF
jgi:hypothetical protein